MNINRYNYEEFFLLYIDNELGSDERQSVETFIKENPDLEEELLMFRQSLLKPDHALVMKDKSLLFKTAKSHLINLENYESFFLLYVDEELNPEERRAVEEFAAGSPALHQELQILMQTRLEPEPRPVFPNKQLLYRNAGSEKVMVVKLWRIVAVAALLLIALGIFWITEKNTGKPGHEVVSKAQPEQSPNLKSSEQKTQKATNPAPSQPDPRLTAVNDGQNTRAIQLKIDKKEKKKTQSPVVKKEEPNQYAVVENAAVTDEAVVHPTDVAKVGTPVEAATNSFENKTLIIDQQYPADKEKIESVFAVKQEEEDRIAIGPVETKNKMRGFFRKVSRVIVKTTHLPASESKSLLIGNIEIALK